MFHNSQAVLALSREENPTIFQKTLGLNDFYFSGPGLRLPDGQHPDGRQVAGADVPRREARRDARWRRAGRCATWRGTRSTSGSRPRTCRGPRTGSRVGRDGTITIAYQASNEEPKKRLYEQLKSMLARPRHAPPPPAAPQRVPEERDPDRGLRAPGGNLPVRRPTRATSVLDPNCKAHELDNLYVVDTSFFPSIGAVNPALTAMANALRVGDHLLERLSARTSVAAEVGAAPS